jgi:hypothetical protein
MWALAGFLVAGVLIGQGLAQSPSVVPFPPTR